MPIFVPLVNTKCLLAVAMLTEFGAPPTTTALQPGSNILTATDDVEDEEFIGQD